MEADIQDIANHYEALETERVLEQEQAVIDELFRIMDQAV